MSLTAEIVNVRSLWETIVAAIIAGIGITVVFSLAVYGFSRAEEMRHADRPSTAAAITAVGILGLAGALAGVALGLIVMTNK